MAITNRKSRWSKIPERFIFVTTPILTLWLLFRSISIGISDSGSYDFREGEIIGMFLFPILLGISYLAVGLVIRRNRLKKEKRLLR